VINKVKPHKTRAAAEVITKSFQKDLMIFFNKKDEDNN